MDLAPFSLAQGRLVYRPWPVTSRLSARRFLVTACAAYDDSDGPRIATSLNCKAISRREVLGLSMIAVTALNVVVSPSHAIQGITAGRIPGKTVLVCRCTGVDVG